MPIVKQMSLSDIQELMEMEVTVVFDFEGHLVVTTKSQYIASRLMTSVG